MFIFRGLVSGEGWSRPPGAMPSYPHTPADGVIVSCSRFAVEQGSSLVIRSPRGKWRLYKLSVYDKLPLRKEGTVFDVRKCTCLSNTLTCSHMILKL